MKRLSSTSTRWLKKVFPGLFFGFLGIFFIFALVSGMAKKNPVFLIAPVFMASVNYFLMRFLVWDMVDEVYDLGNALLVKNNTDEVMVPLADIVNVNWTRFVNPPRISLRLRTDTRLGNEIVFSPAQRILLNPFAKLDIAEDLIRRIDMARTQGKS